MTLPGNLTPLVDGDILAYELSFAAEAYWKYQHAERNEEVVVPPPFDVVQSMMDARIPEIVAESGAVGNPELCFTGNGNFRHFIAATQPYKADRAEKPFHYYNTMFILKLMYKHHIKDGLEADDLMGILLTSYPDKYICISRDKDLRQIPGWHYGWEVGKQPSFGPHKYEGIGEISLTSGKSRKIVGGGMKFFYCQMLMGDRVDTVPGIPGTGPVTAYNIISPCTTIEECENAVAEAYKVAYPDNWKNVMIEQGQLLYMTREVNKNGQIKLWKPFQEDEEWIDYQTGERTILPKAGASGEGNGV